MRGESNKTIKVILLLLTIVLMSFLNLQAQNNGTIDSDTIAYSIHIEDLIVTGTSVPTDAKKVLYQVKTIDAASIQQKGQTQLTEVLASIPTIRVNYDPILGASIKMRGVSADNVSILVDGVPVVGRLDGAIDISQINIQDIKKIEIIEGPLSTIYGNNAAGGVINIITRRSQVQQWRLLLDSQYEYPGIQNHSAKIGFQHSDFFISAGANFFKHQLYPLDSTRVFNSYKDLEGNTFSFKKYPWNPKERISLNGMLRYSLSDVAYITYKYDQSTEDVLDLGAINRPQFKPYAWDRSYNTQRKDHALTIHDERGGLFFDGVLAYNRFNRLFTTDRFDFEENRKVAELQSIDTTIVESIFGKYTVASNFEYPVNFVAGVNYNREIGGGERIQVSIADNPARAENTDLAFFGNINYSPLEKWDIATTARYSINELYGNNFNPGIQLKWNPTQRWSIRAGWATGFRAPSLKERFINFIDVNHYIVGNPDILPESSVDYTLSAGFNRAINNHELQINVNTYFNRITDKIILSQYEVGKFNYQNLETFSSYGIGTDVQFGNDRWQVRSAINLGFWNSGLSPDGSATPVFDFVNGISYTLPYDIKTDLQYRYVGADPNFTESNGEILESSINPYVLMDYNLSKKCFNDKLTLGAGVKNIFNITQTNISGSAASGPHTSGLPSLNVNQGRTFFIRLSYLLGK